MEKDGILEAGLDHGSKLNLELKESMAKGKRSKLDSCSSREIVRFQQWSFSQHVKTCITI